MRIFVTKWFDRWARKEGIADHSLRAAIHEIERGLVDVRLGGGLYKKRIATQTKGKRGGYRTLIAFRAGKRAFFVYGFAKRERDDIDKVAYRALKMLADELFAYDERKIAKAVQANALRELGNDDEQNQT